MRFEVRPATAADLPVARRLLSAANLPTEDLAERHLELVAAGESETLGVIGMERFGDVALLRSLVVAPSGRGAGAGRALVTALEAVAKRRGIQELWLLTIDADPFFLRFGFTVRDRELAPDAIRNSNEFSSLCPADAVLMSKPLLPG